MRIGDTIVRLRSQFPDAAIIVADDGSRDLTKQAAEAAGADVVRTARLGKGEALNAAERVAPPGPLLLCDADVEGDVRPLAETPCDLSIAMFSRRIGGGFGLAKETARRLILARTGFDAREPLSGQRYLTQRARVACFPLARGFGCELRMTVDALDAGLAVEEVELALEHRPTGKTLAGFKHRATQLFDATLAAGPLGVNHRGNRLPMVGLLTGLAGVGCTRRLALSVLGIALVGFADDVWSGPERGFRRHLRVRHSTGTLKLVVIPVIGVAATGSLSGGLLIGLAANALNQLDTKPGRALKSYLLAALPLRSGIGRRYTAMAVLLLPYDLRERGMLGDAGSNALGAVLGLRLVARLTGRERWTAVGILAGLNLLGEFTSIGNLIERTPLLASVDRAGRVTA